MQKQIKANKLYYIYLSFPVESVVSFTVRPPIGKPGETTFVFCNRSKIIHEPALFGKHQIQFSTQKLAIAHFSFFNIPCVSTTGKRS
jgi:hypothetical protein